MNSPATRANPSNGGASLNVEQPRLFATKHEQSCRTRFSIVRQESTGRSALLRVWN
jgi:hypothetical protein